jgi:hypothetical protein
MRRVEGFQNVPNETHGADTEHVPIRVVKNAPRSRRAEEKESPKVGSDMKERTIDQKATVERPKRVIRRKKEAVPETPVVQEPEIVLRERTAAEEAALRAAIDHAQQQDERRESGQRAEKEREMLAQLIAKQEAMQQHVEEPKAAEEAEVPHAMEAAVTETLHESAEARLARMLTTPEQQHIWDEVRDMGVLRFLKPEHYLKTPTHVRIKEYIAELAARTPLPKGKFLWSNETVEEYIARATGADFH